MLFLNVPPFDVLTGQSEPYPGFGDPIVESQTVEKLFTEAECVARKRILDIFGMQFHDVREATPKLDAVISQMWTDGWSPKSEETNLFTTDFGCIFFEALHQTLGGKTVFRSSSDLSHASLWWEPKGVEAYPFHKTYKRLVLGAGESLAFFADNLKRLVEC